MKEIKFRAKWLGLGILLFILSVLLIPASLVQVATLQIVPIANSLIALINMIDVDRGLLWKS
jgi:hypothetical protein